MNGLFFIGTQRMRIAFYKELSRSRLTTIMTLSS